MASVESLQAMLERRLIRQLVRSLAGAANALQRECYLFALRDLVQQADPSLDARLLDEWTEGQLRRWDLWIWEQAPESWKTISLDQRLSSDASADTCPSRRTTGAHILNIGQEKRQTT